MPEISKVNTIALLWCVMTNNKTNVFDLLDKERTTRTKTSKKYYKTITFEILNCIKRIKMLWEELILLRGCALSTVRAVMWEINCLITFILDGHSQLINFVCICQRTRLTYFKYVYLGISV